MNFKDLRINGKRLQQSLETMAKIGATPGGGVQRLTLTDEDKTARDLFVQWLKEIDLDVTIDDMGNIFGRRPGKNNDLPPVMSGSHIDSQPKGGRFDGILGVMGPLEVLRTLHENNIETFRPLVIVDWTNEEGSRFAPAMVASGVWAGALDKDWVYQRTDIHGKRFGDELERIGREELSAARRALPMSLRDSRLGHLNHGRGCFTAMTIAWKIGLLEHALADELPALRHAAREAPAP